MTRPLVIAQALEAIAAGDMIEIDCNTGQARRARVEGWPAYRIVPKPPSRRSRIADGIETAITIVAVLVWTIVAIVLAAVAIPIFYIAARAERA